MPASSKRDTHRRRSSSVTAALNQIPLNQQGDGIRPLRVKSQPSFSPIVAPGLGTPSKVKARPLSRRYVSDGLWNDVKTGKWLLIPSSSFKLSLIAPILYLLHVGLAYAGIEAFQPGGQIPNVGAKCLLPSNEQDGGYAKTWWDVALLVHYIVFWTFVRQFMTLKVLAPLAFKLGVRGGKITRFTEQGYAVFYYGIYVTYGLYVMRSLPTWYYKTEYFFIDYPHKIISFRLKFYYLTQWAFWTQQTIILAAKVEKPRKDYKELVLHHIVTIWLILSSYIAHFTYFGVAIFFTMDTSDLFFSLAKCVNYVSDFWSIPFLVWFTISWTYLRHYLNLLILYNLPTHYDLIPVAARLKLDPFNDSYLDSYGYMKWLIFIPIALLQALNLFWYFLILRILVRAVWNWGEDVKDDRSEDEDEEEEELEELAGKKKE
ncbi:hypothetical protein L202_04442 [Cryptococcus amylolentus CBS 6039]|uniref:TLC domain-containing protein n=1 Tax=Cryptococcus amylolentus CBS 6039 TaxID=1295533 RepID=A0A1E3HRC5_9TREE|nr:hypothetical protein L202_04442 [Cryptococcus amylolentus CBS 6039]ODN78918.1 hypothetical protein L202_04442 [Cryptococcus amylolentus CBS 6039]